MLTAASVAIALVRKGTEWPGLTAGLFAAVHPDHPAAPLRHGRGMQEPGLRSVLRLGAVVRLARAHVLSHVDVLAHPEGQAQHLRPRLGPPEVSPRLPREGRHGTRGAPARAARCLRRCRAGPPRPAR